MAEDKPTKRPYNFKDLTGQRFGRLYVVGFSGIRNEKATFQCLCDCSAMIIVRGNSLSRGNTKSCGCLRVDLATTMGRADHARRGVTHGMSSTKEYRAWKQAKRRCCCARSKDYAAYGGRGITMCDEWMDSFEAFLDHIGPRPDGMSLDRIDVNGNYAPGNVRWTDQVTQVRNQRRTILVTHEGETLTLVEWSERTGIPYATLWHRYKGLNNGPLFGPMRASPSH